MSYFYDGYKYICKKNRRDENIFIISSYRKQGKTA